MSKVQALWNKIGERSIDVAEKSYEAFGVALVTPCPTRWNSLYDSLYCFLKHHTSLENVKKLFRVIGLLLMTKEDIDLLTEYMYVMEPVAKILDILHGEKDVFMGIGVVLPLLTKLKQELTLREFPNLEPIRNKVLASLEKRYYIVKMLPLSKIASNLSALRFGGLFSNYHYRVAACTHPYFKCNWLGQSEADEVIKKMRQLQLDANSPVCEQPPMFTDD